MNTIIAILLGILTMVVGFVAYIASTRANREMAKTAGKAVDAEAYDRAKDIYLAALETARSDLASTRSDLTSARQELAAVRLDLASAREDMRQLSAVNLNLTIQVKGLRKELGRNGNGNGLQKGMP